MIAFFLGSIPMGDSALTGPTALSKSAKKTFVEYPVTRGKPVLHRVGDELTTQSIDFFFSEEFCDPVLELARLKVAYGQSIPLALSMGDGSYAGEHFEIETLSEEIKLTDGRGKVVRVEASMTLKEAPVTNPLGLLKSIAVGRASALGALAINNPTTKR